MMVLEYPLPPQRFGQPFHFCTGIIMFYQREEIMIVLTVNAKTAVTEASPLAPDHILSTLSAFEKDDRRRQGESA